MQFVDIKYVERNTAYGKQFVLSMPGGYGVPKGTVNEAWKLIHQNWNFVDWSERQTAETMIGHDHWVSQSFGARLAMGRCIKFFIVHDMLPSPLKVANPGKKGKRFYRPK